MRLRPLIKRLLYQSYSSKMGRFPYFGVQTSFPAKSLIFRLACEQGIYEATNFRILLSAVRPKTMVFDVGANIGLMSIPLLSHCDRLRVVSVEPSPHNYAALSRTVSESTHCGRWEAIDCALGKAAGLMTFHCAKPELGAFDGFHDTGRAGQTEAVQVQVRTLDELWMERGKAEVCAIKIDVEGAELDVLNGACDCIRTCRPLVLVEWNHENLRAFGYAEDSLIKWADSMSYEVFAAPQLTRVVSAIHLRSLMQFGENFVLLPRE